ncbi:F-box and WD repeat domain containing protein 10B isoform X2 [Narcine bancroftii]|uniref:F-box and WD repeat domain containing protein 10B isoform X2 n=1 Tax=Narcine bancroftii TaxID=1343680 RepID=UPI003831D141
MDAAGEVSEFNISSSPSSTCLSDSCSAAPCGSCSTCALDVRLVATKQWFLRAGDISKQHFLKGLIRRIGSRDLLQELDRLLQPTFGKDFTHSRSCANPSLPGDLGTQGSDRGLNKSALRSSMLDTWKWFANSRYWTKANYVLGVLQLCDVKLLYLLANLVRALVLSERTSGCPVAKVGDNDEDVISRNKSKYSLKTDGRPELQELDDSWPPFTVISPDIMLSSFVKQPTEDIDHSPLGKRVSRTKKKHSRKVVQDAPANIESPAPIIVTSSSQATSGVSHYKDFIRCLPVHLAKYILGFLDEATLQNCMFVSQHWHYLAKEVMRDVLALHCIFHEVLKLQELGNTTKRKTVEKYKEKNNMKIKRAKSKGGQKVKKRKGEKKETYVEICIRQLENKEVRLIKRKLKKNAYSTQPKEIVPQNISAVYAKMCQIPVPSMNEKGLTIPAENFDKKVGLTSAYTDIATDMIQMEERNVYCGPYNIKIIKQHTDPNRVIHYSGGIMIASGSSDRKIRFLDIKRSKKITSVIQGHAGSIKTLLLCEEQNFVLSGSFDLSIRRWNLKTGSCMTIYRGHMGVITSLDLHKDKFVSGAIDGFTKVWDLEQGKCISSLRHEKPVISVAVGEVNVVSGYENGEVLVWTLKPPSLVKVLTGHKGPVRCLSFDQWHLVSGSDDTSVMVWSMIGKFSKCLLTFKHPREVLCLHHLYLRVLSGCNDGKIRIFDLYRGTCLRVMRASGRGDPVLSFHLSEKSIVINTINNVVAFHFENITWDYSAPSAVIENPAQEDSFRTAPLRKQPYSYVRAQRLRRIGSTNEKIYHRQEDLTQQRLSHHARLMSTRCMQEAQRIQSDSMKIPNLREFHYHCPDATPISQKSELLFQPSPTGWVSSNSGMLSQGRSSDGAISSIGYDKRTDPLSRASSKQDTLKHIKNRRLARPTTSEQIYLTVNAIQNSSGFEETKINSLDNISFSDDYSQPLCHLNEMERRCIEKEHKVKQSNIIENQTASTAEYVDVQTFLPGFDFTKQKHNEQYIFHPLNSTYFVTKPMSKRSKSSLGFASPVQFINEKNKPQTAIGNMPKKSKVANDSKERNEPKSFQVPNATISSAPAKLKSHRIIINPFRDKSGFILWTSKQQKEYQEKIIADRNQKKREQEKGYG